jgi:hypothetical protein
LFAQPDRCREAARDSFFANELTCSETNRRLKPYIEGEKRLNALLGGRIHKMQRYISAVLGDFHDFLAEIPELVKVTPGATAHAKRRDSLPQLKMTLKPWVTPRAKSYVWSLYHLFGFEKTRLRECRSNRIELVPKNWKTDRTIACEPEGNLPLQLAFDTYVKRKLRRFGIDLRNQSANMKRAKHASVYGDFATVDFSAASDTISYNVVQWLLPEDWVKFLCDVRSPAFRGVFGEGVYAKFSSMGNGATFVLETLLFAALCHACGSKEFLVYGDDVIIETELFEAYVALAQFLGFTVNVDKSFYSGPFRESCGGDYYNGIDVTPVFIRGLDKRKASLCHLVNTCRALTFPGSALGAFLSSICEDEKLPKVPWNESTLSGVWIDPSEARRLGILKKHCVRPKGPCLDHYKSYVPKSTMRSFRNVRGYYLWFLYKRRQISFAGPWVDQGTHDPLQTSSVPVFRHKYVRKWVVWGNPNEAMPDHILWS